MARTKTTPYRRTPGTKYQYSGMRTPVRGGTYGRARRVLDFGTPVRVPRSITANRPTTRTKIGFPFGAGTALKRVVVNKWANLTTLIDPRVLISDELTTIPQKTLTQTGIDHRERAMINCLGFTVRIFLQNTLPFNAVTVRMAVVSPTDKNEVNDNEFFRGYADSRALDFSTVLDSHQYINNPINTDNYTVLWSSSCDVMPDSNINGNFQYAREGANWKSITKYIPLNRQLRYDGTLSSECADKVFLLVWYDGIGTEAATPVAAASVQYKRYAIAHFKDPGN